MRRFVALICGVVSFVGMLVAQDSVDVTFWYKPTVSASRVYVPGEFNSWANNTSGTISSANTNALMTSDNASGKWYRTVRLLLGRTGGAIAGAYQYKFNVNGASSGWVSDPLNPRTNPADNNNSILYVQDPVIYQFIPNQVSGLVRTALPTISAFIFPKVGAAIDTSSIRMTIDGVQYQNGGFRYDTLARQLSFSVPSSLRNGSHTAILTVGSTGGGTNRDSVTFTTQAGFVQITTQGGYGTSNPVKAVRGVVQDTSIHSVKLIRNSRDTAFVPVSGGSFSFSETLMEGINVLSAVVDTGGVSLKSDSISITLIVNHLPYARASVAASTSTQVTLSAAGSTHPDGRAMTYTWIDDPRTPLSLNRQHGTTVTVSKPAHAGEYYFYLVAADSSGASDTTRSAILVSDTGSCTSPTIAQNPEWAKRARVYFLFPKSCSAAGTIPAAAQRLQYIHDMGFNVLWIMPVMKNAYPIDQHYGPGYNIVDFTTVAPEYGTNDDFKNFVAQAHSLGMKVVLDVTPNHTSRYHPWSVDAHTFHQDSRYWTWYEHNTITYNTNGLGDALDADGFNYYSGFSDQLLNYNWKDIDARTEMINVYKFWIKFADIDGYRFDVYWGPHRRYGETYMGIPVREALKHIKPDILLLGEDDGTGVGTQYIYADQGGGVDAAYDFKLYFNQIRGFGFTSTAVDNLQTEIANGGYYPGANSLYMRFMESQDEDRITYFYSNANALDAMTTFNRTKPMATVIFSVPGFPMIWNGQEVGWGYGISGAKEDRSRSTIAWDFQGKPVLTPHYQRLAWIRGTFPAFATQAFERIGTGNGSVYGILRKYQDETAISLCNFSSGNAQASLTFTATGTPNVLLSNSQDGKTYYVNDVYNDTSYQFSLSGGSANFSLTLPAYGSAILIVADTIKKVSVPTLTAVGPESAVSRPISYRLDQNYPNPFNPSTTVVFELPKSGYISVRVYNVLGEEIALLARGSYAAGVHQVQWNGRTHHGTVASSGVYFVRLEATGASDVKKILLMK